MFQTRTIYAVEKPRQTFEGAGVKLKRVFGRIDSKLDPFLLLDQFGSENPQDYIAGFPWHPHRGIETITYLLEGNVKHGDSLGNTGEISQGDVQWMTAGSGIIHEEMPQKSKQLHGFQLWSNLPRANKMMPPRYRDIRSSQIPLVTIEPGIQASIISGSWDKYTGPVKDVVTNPLYFDITIEEGKTFQFEIPREYNAFIYIYQGSVVTGNRSQHIEQDNLVVFDTGDYVSVLGMQAINKFLLVAAKPLQEPVAWRGPIVMNSQEELETAFLEFQTGTFIKD